MIITPNKINRWMLINLPAAWLSGVRLTFINEKNVKLKLGLNGLIKILTGLCFGQFRVWQLN